MKSNHQSHPMRIGFITLGCAKNLIDTEKMLAFLVQDGMALVGSDDPADVLIINTCGFIADARAEAMEHIAGALERKRSGRVARVIVAGCLAQYWAQKLTKQFPDIDAVVGLAHRGQIAGIVKEVIQRKTSTPGQSQSPLIYNDEFDRQIFSDQVRLRITEPYWSYLRISEGCDRRCSFCTIPEIRGRFRSKSMEAVIAEAEELVTDGVVELNLIAQETSGYGLDLGPGNDLATLLRELDGIDRLQWIRILYTHPATITDAQIKAMAQCEKVVPYIDIPLQHISDRILKLMHRGIDRSQTEQLLAKLRCSIDNLTIRTTMLVGFPSETEAEFNELLDFIKDFRFEAMGCFKYSAEEGTPAARLKGPIPDEIKHRRMEQLMLAQQEIVFEHAQKLSGRCIQCLITGWMEQEEIQVMELDTSHCWLLARHLGQAPEIDSRCYLSAEPGNGIEPGMILPARINGRYDYDLIGDIRCV